MKKLFAVKSDKTGFVKFNHCPHSFGYDITQPVSENGVVYFNSKKAAKCLRDFMNSRCDVPIFYVVKGPDNIMVRKEKS